MVDTGSDVMQMAKMFEQEESANGRFCDHGDGNHGNDNHGDGNQVDGNHGDRDDSQISTEQETDGAVAAKKPSFVPVLEKCAECGKTVYALEKLEVNKKLYHRACVRCSYCKAVVTTKNMSVNEGVIFCTPHFKQLFARRGNYDEGFGRNQYKKKWAVAENGETS